MHLNIWSRQHFQDKKSGGIRVNKLEDLKVLKRSPDLLNNVKIGQGQLRLLIQTYFVLPYMGNGHFDQVTQKYYHIYSFIH